MTLASKLKKGGVVAWQPVWTGPGGEGPEGGATQSLIGRFLACRERFRLLVVEGYKPTDMFNSRMEYGNFWHTAEEAVGKKQPWEEAIREYAKKMIAKYRMQQNEITRWYQICLVQFPIALSYWKNHPEKIKRTPILAEEVFDVPYMLPSGRTVRLRGKWDGLSYCENKKDPSFKPGLYQDEHKSKGNPDKVEIARQLKFDLQTMTYRVALDAHRQNILDDLQAHLSWKKSETGGVSPYAKWRERYTQTQLDFLVEKKFAPVVGVRYNVVKRPLSGGKGSIVQLKGTDGAKCGKCTATGEFKGDVCPKCEGAKRVGAKPPETDEEYLVRLGGVITENSDDFFHRWTVEVSQEDVDKFRRECLDPILEQMHDWWEWVRGYTHAQTGEPVPGFDPFGGADGGATNTIHWRHPFGVYNSVDETGHSDVDNFLETGSIVGLQRTKSLFQELEV